MNSMIAHAQQPDVFSALHNPALSAYVRNAADLMPDESALLATAIRSLLVSQGHASNKGGSRFNRVKNHVKAIIHCLN
ncbi:hypothetical protein QDQ11_22725 [Enterobacter hormaechei]|uniref:hypothetical protein n=1 Tax=Enterobacter hormaechei TaxID=158836 RepID=UPI00334FE118